jgi:hypothetical protein
MGTRGVYGFRKNGVDKTGYNHFDSHPQYLGARIVAFCHDTAIAEMHRIYDKIIPVGGQKKPTAAQIAECAPYTDLEVSDRSTDDWYCLLRETQGRLDIYNGAFPYMFSSGAFIRDSRWCEYGYIINLDEGALEFWQGYQREPQPGNRYGAISDGSYYPCRLMLSFPLDDIPENAVELMKE